MGARRHVSKIGPLSSPSLLWRVSTYRALRNVWELSRDDGGSSQGNDGLRELHFVGIW